MISYHEEGTLKKKLQSNGYSFCCIFLRCFYWVAIWQWPDQFVWKRSECRYL